MYTGERVRRRVGELGGGVIHFPSMYIVLKCPCEDGLDGWIDGDVTFLAFIQNLHKGGRF